LCCCIHMIRVVCAAGFTWLALCCCIHMIHVVCAVGFTLLALCCCVQRIHVVCAAGFTYFTLYLVLLESQFSRSFMLMDSHYTHFVLCC
jgi:hypothetical protein